MFLPLGFTRENKYKHHSTGVGGLQSLNMSKAEEYSTLIKNGGEGTEFAESGDGGGRNSGAVEEGGKPEGDTEKERASEQGIGDY